LDGQSQRTAEQADTDNGYLPKTHGVSFKFQAPSFKLVPLRLDL
jgi:hypothetical protein